MQRLKPKSRSRKTQVGPFIVCSNNPFMFVVCQNPGSPLYIPAGYTQMLCIGSIPKHFASWTLARSSEVCTSRFDPSLGLRDKIFDQDRRVILSLPAGRHQSLKKLERRKYLSTVNLVTRTIARNCPKKKANNVVNIDFPVCERYHRRFYKTRICGAPWVGYGESQSQRRPSTLSLGQH